MPGGGSHRFARQTHRHNNKGGETASTGIYKYGLHVEDSITLVNPVELNIVADDYAYAAAA